MSISTCQICGGHAPQIDEVDMARSCLPKQISTSTEKTPYAQCTICGFCFAPEFHTWTPEDFASKIYNDEYIKFDPAYVLERPQSNASILQRIFGNIASSHTHLDYGGGSGITSEILRARGWNSRTFDPFSANVENKKNPTEKFNLITAFEVFEHAPDTHSLLNDLVTLLAEDGFVFFSTLLSDDNISANGPLTWWYAGPRNGHISLYSYQSLKILANTYGLQFESYSVGIHSFFRKKPDWASHLTPRPETDIHKSAKNQIVTSLFGKVICDTKGPIEDLALLCYGEFRNAHTNAFIKIINKKDNILELGALNASFSLPISKHVSEGNLVSLCASHAASHKVAAALSINNCSNSAVYPLSETDIHIDLFLELAMPQTFQAILSHFSVRNTLVNLRRIRKHISHKPILYARTLPDEDINSLIEYLQSEGYRYWFISSKEYNPSNHFKNERNIFGNADIVYMLCAPRDSSFEIPML